MSGNGTKIKPRGSLLYFDNVDIETKAQAESLDDELSNNYDKLKGELFGLIMATPKDITPNGENPIDYIKEQTDDILSRLHENIYDKTTVDIINQILYNWEYTYAGEEKDIYSNCNTDDEINKYAFPQDKHVEIKHDLNNFIFAPEDDDIKDAIDRSLSNINYQLLLYQFFTDKYIILIGNHLYVDYDSQFLFKSESNAKKVLMKKLDFHCHDYLDRRFIEKHPNFFPSIIKLMIEHEYDKNKRFKFEEELKKFENDSKINLECLNRLYEILNDFFFQEIKNRLNIRIIHLGNLIKKSGE